MAINKQPKAVRENLPKSEKNKPTGGKAQSALEAKQLPHAAKRKREERAGFESTAPARRGGKPFGPSGHSATHFEDLQRCTELCIKRLIKMLDDKPEIPVRKLLTIVVVLDRLGGMWLEDCLWLHFHGFEEFLPKFIQAKPSSRRYGE